MPDARGAFTARSWVRRALVGLLALSAGGCYGSPSALDPRTEATARIAELGWVMIALGTVTAIVTIGALVAAVAARRPRSARATSEVEGAWTVVVGGMLVPGVVIAGLLGYTVYTIQAVAGTGGPSGATQPDHAEHGTLGSRDPAIGARPSFSVAISGTQWWWRLSYPDQHLVTANEIHVPVGAAIRIAVTSEDVIHSLWIPQLMGKVDMIPSRTNLVTLMPDQRGVFRGMCAEFCGYQHAHMHLRVFVDSEAEFAEWLANEQRDAVAPSEPRLVHGQSVFLSAGCGECHTVRGTPAAGTRGPDLTHVASRQTLGAGTHENNRVNLSGWTTDPQGMKVRNKMPATPVERADLEPLVDYLESLR